MNIGSLTDRLLQFCLVLVGRFRGGLGHVNVVANMIFAGMSGSGYRRRRRDRAHHHRHDDQKRSLSGSLCRRHHRLRRHHRADHSAFNPDGALRADIRHVDWLPIPRRLRPRSHARRRIHGRERYHCATTQLSGRTADPGARDSAHHVAGIPCADAAGHPAIRHLRRRDDPDRRRRCSRVLRAVRINRALPRGDVAAAL